MQPCSNIMILVQKNKHLSNILELAILNHCASLNLGYYTTTIYRLLTKAQKAFVYCNQMKIAYFYPGFMLEFQIS